MNGNLSKWNSVASFGTGLGALRADKAGSAPFAGGADSRLADGRKFGADKNVYLKMFILLQNAAVSWLWQALLLARDWLEIFLGVEERAFPSRKERIVV